MNIAIGMPIGEIVRHETLTTVALMAYHAGCNGHGFKLINAEGPYIDENKNEIMRIARDTDMDYLMFIETDVEYVGKGDVLTHMINLNEDVVSGIYYTSKYPHRPVISNFTDGKERILPDSWENEPFYMDTGSSGFMLISKKVIRAFTDDVINDMGRPFDRWNENNQLRWKEDLAFYWRLKLLDFKVLIDPRLKLAHIKKVKITEDYFRASMEHMKREKAA